MEYEIYADVWFLMNFIMDSAALLIAGKLMKERIRARRLLLGSFAGTSASMLLFFQLKDYNWYQIYVHFLVNPLMVYLCYRSRSKKQFLGQWAVTYLAFILLGGILEWGMAGGAGSMQLILWLPAAAVFLMITGRLLGNLKREKETVVGIFQKSKNFGFVVPDNKKFGTDIFISKSKCKEAKNNDKVIAKILKYPERGKNAEGEIIEILGNVQASVVLKDS